MNRDEIIRMAREASILGSFDMLQGNQWRQDIIRDLERFAALVAAAEREACIDINAMHGGSVEVEAAIRARGNV